MNFGKTTGQRIEPEVKGVATSGRATRMTGNKVTCRHTLLLSKEAKEVSNPTWTVRSDFVRPPAGFAEVTWRVSTALRRHGTGNGGPPVNRPIRSDSPPPPLDSR